MTKTLLYKIAARAGELANLQMFELRREAAGAGVDKWGSRGRVLEALLFEEFENKCYEPGEENDSGADVRHQP
jgi:hypothetical protein